MVIGGGKTLMKIRVGGSCAGHRSGRQARRHRRCRTNPRATVRFSSVNRHSNTTFDGRVVTLPSVWADQGGQSNHRAQVMLENQSAARCECLTLGLGSRSVNIPR
jgi:hypothetical protein